MIEGSASILWGIVKRKKITLAKSRKWPDLQAYRRKCAFVIEHLQNARKIPPMSEEETRAGANPASQTPPLPVLLPEEIHNPNITEHMLNAQLAECLAMMRDAVWLYRVEPREPHERARFVDQAVSLMKASSDMGAMIHRLKSGDPKPHEKVQRHIVEHVVRPPREGEGVPAISKND
jgi:hypothetical protein